MIAAIASFVVSRFAAIGDACSVSGGNFLGFPTWYKYLPGQVAANGDPSSSSATVCIPKVGQLSDVWLIVAAIIEILLRIAALAAVGFVLYGGIRLLTSQGDPGKTKAARQTIINALIGLVIAVSATTIISFIAGSFS